MRYANFKYCGRESNSIGDQMQIIALDYIYAQMGLPKCEIVYIDKNVLRDYDGEPVILPIAFPLYEYSEKGMQTCFSDKIKPIFLGITLIVDELSIEEIAYYKKYEPIGCRDERVYQLFLKHGIDCYLNGCITAVLPKRRTEDAKKIFLVDIPKELFQELPQEIVNDAEVMSHFISDEVVDIKQLALERYERYRKEAKLVITSLLHCAIPCLAAGIPVILVKKKMSYRFAWTEKLLPIYLEDSFSKIDYNAIPVDYEEHKKQLLKVLIERIQGQNNRNEIDKIHQFYMSRNKQPYSLDSFEVIRAFIEKNWKDRTIAYKYGIWGLTQYSQLTVSYIKRNYPNAVLQHVYDKYRSITFEGIKTISPENIKTFENEYIFVTAQAAKYAANEYFRKIHRSDNMYVIAEVQY